MQHFAGDFEHLLHDRRRAFFLGQLQAGTPTFQSQFFGDLFGKGQRRLVAVFHAQHRNGRAQTQIAHAVAAFADDFVALFFQRQAVDFHHVVQHAGEDADGLAVIVPIERGFLAERLMHEAGQVDRAQQTGTVRRQRLLAAGLVARMCSQNQLLFISLTLSIRMKPGSA